MSNSHALINDALVIENLMLNNVQYALEALLSESVYDL